MVKTMQIGETSVRELHIAFLDHCEGEDCTKPATHGVTMRVGHMTDEYGDFCLQCVHRGVAPILTGRHLPEEANLSAAQ
jgi:hypothetical protein